MTSLRRALWGIGGLTFLLGVGASALIWTSDYEEARGVVIVLALLGFWGFVAAGLYAWARRPDNRIGGVMVLTGFFWLLMALKSTDPPLLFSIAMLGGNLFAAGLIHLLLAFPSGELQSRADRWVVAATYLLVTVGLLPMYLFTDEATNDCTDCPHYLFEVTNSSFVANVMSPFADIAGSILLVAVLVAIVRRWRRANKAQRRILFPVYAAGAFVAASLMLSLGVELVGLPEHASDWLFWFAALAFVLMPFFFLGGLARSRILAAGAVADMITRLAETPEPGELRDALAEALRDDSLTLAYWIPGAQRYIAADGQPVRLPEPGSGRVLTPVDRDGERVAAIIHQALADDDADLLDAVGGAAALALDNARLEAELRSRLEELHASRARIVEAGVTERRRLERDLHDGAQQRLVSLALTMRMARGKVGTDPAGAEALLEAAGSELDLALAELRELARGIHPAVLSDRGLGAALEGLAGRAPLPVELEHSAGDGLPDAVESAAYFVVAEALTNVAKYAEATQAKVAVGRENGNVLVEVVDDGVGGADPEQGTGLRGLSDRVAALDGRLAVVSAPGRGTTISARIPCA